MTPQQFWRPPFGLSPWTPLAGDADGDGRADLLAIGPGGETRIELARTSALGKPVPSNVAREGFGNGAVASACGRFFPGSLSAGMLVAMVDGTIHLAWGMAPGTNTYQHLDPVALVPPDDTPQTPTRTAAADFDGDGKLDAMILDKAGKLLLLKNMIGTDGKPKFTPFPLPAAILGIRQFAAGSIGGKKAAQCIWLDTAGNLIRVP